jgi:hypothetical protein
MKARVGKLMRDREAWRSTRIIIAVRILLVIVSAVELEAIIALRDIFSRLAIVLVRRRGENL